MRSAIGRFGITGPAQVRAHGVGACVGGCARGYGCMLAWVYVCVDVGACMHKFAIMHWLLQGGDG